MASLVSGAYIVSSNRVGRSKSGTQFGGGGFAYAPQGQLLAVTSASNPLVKLELDPTNLHPRKRITPATFLNLNKETNSSLN